MHDLLPAYNFSEAAQHFVPGPKAGDARGELLAPEGSMLWGPGGCLAGGVGEWAALHAASFSRQHLSAFHRLCGTSHTSDGSSTPDAEALIANL